MKSLKYFLVILFAFAIGYYINQYSPHYQIIKGEVFHTYYKIKIRTDNKNNKLKDIIEAKLKDIDNIMSVFNPISEISKVNDTSAGQRIKLSPELSKIMRASDKIYWQTSGKFDITIGQLIDIWGFGKSNHPDNNPKSIREAVKYSGFNKILFKNNFSTIRKTNNHVKFNLSSIAKGYAVDEISNLLSAMGYQDYMIEIGGEILTKGYRAQPSEAWTIGINKPEIGSVENSLVISLSNLAVATSGNYRNYYKKNNKIYSHIISPKNGYPVTSEIISATVFHPSCMYADAYATALMAMSTKEALQFAEKYKLRVIFFDKNYQIHVSSSAKSIFN